MCWCRIENLREIVQASQHEIMNRVPEDTQALTDKATLLLDNIPDLVTDESLFNRYVKCRDTSAKKMTELKKDIFYSTEAQAPGESWSLPNNDKAESGVKSWQWVLRVCVCVCVCVEVACAHLVPPSCLAT